MIQQLLRTIGNTPLIRLQNCTKATEGELLIKYERYNPGGSIKDRPAIHIIEEAERRGWLQPGGTIIESSSGNFGISLAMIGAVKGYHVIILADPKTTSANLALLRAYGAEVIIVTEQDDSGSYHKTRIALANKLANEIANSFRPDQCFSLLNGEAHYRSTAREIVEACDGQLHTLIAPVSTGGQLGGIAKYLKEYLDEVNIIAVDAVGSTIFGGEAHPYRIPGVGLSWTPVNLKLEHIDRVYKVSDREAFVTARAMARYEGFLMGPSSGACILVALKIAQQLSAGERVVAMAPDGGERYIDTLYNDEWMSEQGFEPVHHIEELRAMARELQPWSEQPRDCKNDQHNLEEMLDIPHSTQTINAELLEDGHITYKK